MSGRTLGQNANGDNLYEEVRAIAGGRPLTAWFEGLRNVLWLGAVSFEERCKGSLEVLLKLGVKLKRGIALNYQTNVRPGPHAEDRRNENWRDLERLARTVMIEGIERRSAPAYLFQAAEETLNELVSDPEVDAIVLDITCLTKIHALAAASVLARRTGTPRWVAAYSMPENYGIDPERNQDLPAWKDIIIAPLAETAQLFNETSGRGIILPGHEADRLIIALSEIEPAGGLIAVADTKRRPDLRYITQRRNQKTIQQLARMRASNWVKRVVGVTDTWMLGRYVDQQIQLAMQHEAPVILFPFGPKSMVFAAAHRLAGRYPESSWFVYPIPSSYDAEYSSGLDDTIWLFPREDE
jgi:hypothetical protein